MEVHHHPHSTPMANEGKKFKHYFFEFVMIFLAVTLGFFAESLREHITDHEKEKQYMQSLIIDLQNDLIEMNNKEMSLKNFPGALNTLAEDCNKAELTDSAQLEMYDFNMRYLGTMQIYFADKTASQLKNAGGMRLIRNAKVADSILIYWQGVDDLKFTYSNYENYRRSLRQLSFKIFNYTNYLEYDEVKMEFSNIRPHLTTQDPALLKEYGSEVWLVASNIVKFYLPAIEKQKAMASDLVVLIKKEYHLK